MIGKEIKNFKKEKKFIDENTQKKIYSIMLILLMIGFAPYYYRIILNTSPLFNKDTHHYYEYYVTSALLSYSLKSGNLKMFSLVWFYSFCDKLIFLIRVPVFLIFGVSHFVFVYSNYFFNFMLLIILFWVLLKIFKPLKAFLFILFIFSNYFFLFYLIARKTSNHKLTVEYRLVLREV
jgi:hypothetical protein